MASEWISVKDRLPKDQERVLVCNGSTRPYSDAYSFRTCHLKDAWPIGSNSTHWQPLPAPPEEGK